MDLFYLLVTKIDKVSQTIMKLWSVCISTYFAKLIIHRE